MDSNLWNIVRIYKSQLHEKVWLVVENEKPRYCTLNCNSIPCHIGL